MKSEDIMTYFLLLLEFQRYWMRNSRKDLEPWEIYAGSSPLKNWLSFLPGFLSYWWDGGR